MEIFVNSKRYIKNISNFLIDICKELSLVLWVTFVFMLILWSYIQSEYSISQHQELDLYEQVSISQEMEDEKFFVEFDDYKI